MFGTTETTEAVETGNDLDVESALEDALFRQLRQFATPDLPDSSDDDL